MNKLFCYRVFFLLLLPATGAYSAGLMDVYQAAIENDPQWSALQHGYQGEKQSITQARGALLPSVVLTGNSFSNNSNTDEKDANGLPVINHRLKYDTKNITGSIVQPIFHLDKLYQYQQVRENDKKVELQFREDKQDFILRVVKAYFKVLRQQASLTFTEADQAAINKQLEQARSRFEVGFSSISDVHDAQAAFDLAEVNRILAEDDLSIAQEQLIAITGQSVEAVGIIIDELTPFTLEPATEEEWVSLALERNRNHQIARIDKKMASLALKEKKANYLPTVDLVARKTETEGLGRPRFDPVSGAQFPPTDGSDSENTQLGIEFRAVLFQGGIINSQRKQAVQQHMQAQDRFDFTRRTIVQDTKNGFRRIKVDMARLVAREQAVVSSQSALDGAKAGYEVGERNIVDLLEAQRRSHGAVKDLFNARLDYFFDYLQLKSLSAGLDETVLQEVAQRFRQQ